MTATRPNVRDMYGPTAEDIGSADLMVYMCHDSSGNDFTVGLAPTGSICGNRDEYKLSINEWESTASGFANVILFSSHYILEEGSMPGCVIRTLVIFLIKLFGT